MTKLLHGMGVLAITVIAGVSGCGGSSSCGGVQPCGGDPTGNWRLTSECATSASMSFNDPDCPTATARILSLSASGNMTFNADMTYMVGVTETGTVQVTMPASCLTMNGITITCAQLQQGIVAAAGPNPPFTSVSCSGSSSCNCNLSVSTTTNEAGTWATAGTVMTTTPASGISDSNDYCVKGNELHLISVDTTMPMGPMGQVKIAADVVAVRQ